MSTILVIGRQNSNIDRPVYGSRGPFASKNQSKEGLLNTDVFDHALSFLGPKDLDSSASVCHDWHRYINSTNQWKKQCQMLLDIPPQTDPMNYLPKKCPSYKKGLQLLFSRILDARVYEPYLGAKIGPVPPIPKEIPLKLGNKPDRCTLYKTIGEKYDWTYFPSHVEIEVPGDFSLDKPDNPNDPEAPKLIRNEASFGEKFARKIGRGKKIENKTLKVPVTINNIAELLKIKKLLNLYILDKIIAQHGNKRILPGWACMRKKATFKNFSFTTQQNSARRAGVEITDLVRRVWFDVFKYARSENKQDALHVKPIIYARTSTLTRLFGRDYPSACGFSAQYHGLIVKDPDIFESCYTGVAVALSLQNSVDEEKT